MNCDGVKRTSGKTSNLQPVTVVYLEDPYTALHYEMNFPSREAAERAIANSASNIRVLAIKDRELTCGDCQNVYESKSGHKWCWCDPRDEDEQGHLVDDDDEPCEAFWGGDQ